MIREMSYFFILWNYSFFSIAFKTIVFVLEYSTVYMYVTLVIHFRTGFYEIFPSQIREIKYA